MKARPAILSGIFVWALASAQQPVAQKPVSDKKGRFITDLSKDDFSVTENKKPQVIQEFTAETDLPLRIAILIDTSNSIRDRFKFEQEAAVEFINSTIRPREDKAMVVS